MTASHIVRPRLEQLGTIISDVFTAEIIDVGNTVSLTSSTSVSMVFNFDLETDTAGNFINRNLLHTSAPQSRFFNVHWDTSLTSIDTSVVVSARIEVVPEVVATIDLPYADLQTLTVTPVWSLADTLYNVDFPIDFNVLYGDQPTRSIASEIGLGRWNGRLVFEIAPSTTALWTFIKATDVDITAVPFFSGFEHIQAPKRPVVDMRSGLPAAAEDLVEDDYTPGIWTSPENWDPIDPTWVEVIDFNPLEGVKKDDVPA